MNFFFPCCCCCLYVIDGGGGGGVVLIVVVVVVDLTFSSPEKPSPWTQGRLQSLWSGGILYRGNLHTYVVSHPFVVPAEVQCADSSSFGGEIQSTAVANSGTDR